MVRLLFILFAYVTSLTILTFLAVATFEYRMARAPTFPVATARGAGRIHTFSIAHSPTYSPASVPDPGFRVGEAFLFGYVHRTVSPSFCLCALFLSPLLTTLLSLEGRPRFVPFSRATSERPSDNIIPPWSKSHSRHVCDTCGYPSWPVPAIPPWLHQGPCLACQDVMSFHQSP